MSSLNEIHKEWYRYQQIGAAPADYHLRQQMLLREGPCIAMHYQMIVDHDRAGEICCRQVWVPRKPRADHLH